MGRWLAWLITGVGVAVFGLAWWRADGSAPFYVLAFTLWLLGAVMGVHRRA